MRLILVLIIGLLGNLINLSAQFISNPSFEGPIGHSICPPDWYFCNAEATPDTGPYFSDYPASDGSTYVGLVMRGLMNPNPKNEDIVTELIKPLYRDSIYFLTLDMALAPYVFDAYEGSLLYYNNPARLRISGGKDSCLMDEIFYVSDIVNDTVWKNYDLEIIPKTNKINYLKLEIYLDTMLASYIILDNLQLDYLKILGPSNVCAGDQDVNYRVPLNSCISNLNWNYSGTGVSIVGNANTISLNFDEEASSGNLTVSFNYCSRGIISLVLPITVDTQSPDQPGDIIGPREVCQGQQMVTYYPTNSNASVNNWTCDIPWATYVNYSDSLVVDFSQISESGIITLRGNSACKSELPVTVNPLPSDGGEIIGEHEVCPNQQDVIYIVAEIENATSYSWYFEENGASFNGTGDTISIDFSNEFNFGYLYVAGNNSCGSAYTSDYFSINAIPIPTSANLITGNDNVCKNETGVYYQVHNLDYSANYIWNYDGSGVNIRGNTWIAELDFSDSATSGNLTVTSIINCGTGLPSPSLAINVDSIPAAPEIIYGDTEVCAYHNNMYSVEPVKNAFIYYWNYSGNGEIIESNFDSTNIIFTNADNSGELTVSVSNRCGTGELSPPLSIIVNPCNINIPNSFSPNGDGANDYFIIRNLNEYSSLIIFDRLGKIVFETEYYQNDWNGEDLDGKKLEPDTYWYVFTTRRPKQEYKGFVYLKR